jgi:hypothetical protein
LILTKTATMPGNPVRTTPQLLRACAVLAILLGSCAPGAERPLDDDDDGSGGADDEGGSGGKGGRGGSGGARSGGSGGSLSATGGKGGMATGGKGGGGSGGQGGMATGGTVKGGAGGVGTGGMGLGGSVATGGTIGGDPDCPPTNPPKFCTIQLYLVNCVFCHTAINKRIRVELTEGAGLRERLVNQKAVAPELADCPVKTLVVPGKPEESLLYLKVAGTLPANCGKLMPDKEPGQKAPPPPFSPSELKLVYDWIKGGAVP